MLVSGPGVPSGTTISSIDATNNTITLSAAATASGSPVTLMFETGTRMARASGRLTIDPGVVVKLQGSRIELERGNAQLYAEGTPQKRVIFTSTKDNRFGAGGTFVVTGGTGNVPLAGDWGGIIVNDAAAARRPWPEGSPRPTPSPSIWERCGWPTAGWRTTPAASS
jgi:hypothetical protein